MNESDLSLIPIAIKDTFSTGKTNDNHIILIGSKCNSFSIRINKRNRKQIITLNTILVQMYIMKQLLLLIYLP